MKKFIFTGNTTTDCILKQAEVIKNGEKIIFSTTEVALAVNGKKPNEVDFFNISIYGKVAEAVVKYCGKGSKIGVEGHIKNNNYTNKEGKKVYSFKFVAEAVEFFNCKEPGKQGEHEHKEEEQNKTFTVPNSEDFIDL